MKPSMKRFTAQDDPRQLDLFPYHDGSVIPHPPPMGGKLFVPQSKRRTRVGATRWQDVGKSPKGQGQP